MTNNFDHSDDDSGLNAEDLKFFKNRAKFLGNFAQADLAVVSKDGEKLKKDKKRNPAGLDALEAAEDAQATALRKMQSSLQKKEELCEESEEDELDRRAKKNKTSIENAEAEVKLGLPVRTATGEWKRQSIKKSVVTEVKEKEIKIEDEQEAIDTNNNNLVTTNNLITPTLPSFDEAKERLALVAMEINEDIDENVTKLKELLKYTRIGCIKGSREEEVELMRMGLITCLAVFKDILPDYPIRALTESERQAKVSKEVKKQRHFEETLLRSYSQYIDRLEEILKTVKRGDAGAVAVAVGCLGELAINRGNFNHNERVLSALCGQVFSGKEHIAGVALTSVGRVFAEDETGRSTSHALRLLSDAIQARDYLPEPGPLQVLQNVRMKVLNYSRTDALPSDKRIASEEAARLDIYKKKAQHLSKAQKKNLKAELAESINTARSEAEFSREERSKWSSDALKFLFRILFGILKRVSGDKADKAVSLLPEVLKSLSRCAQFLSVEYFADLLATLKKTISLIEKEQSLTATLHTVHTVLQIVSLQETSKVEILKGTTADMKFYFDLIYRQLLNFHTAAPTWSREFELLLESVMSKLFLAKKHCPATRVAAFIHRFALLIEDPTNPGDAKIYFLRLISRLMENHEKTRGLLDEETLGVAAYLPNCADPDLCNPFCKRLDMDVLVKKVPKVPNDILSLLKRIKNESKSI